MNYLLINNIEKFNNINVLGANIKDLCSSYNIIESLDDVNGDGYTIIIPSNVFFIDDKAIEEIVEYYNMKKYGFTYVCKGSTKLGIYVIDNSLVKKDISELESKFNNAGFSSNRFYHFNDFYELSLVEEELKRIINKKLMISGVRIDNPETVSISPLSEIESGAYIKKGTIISGKSIIKKGAQVGPDSEILDSFIDEDALVRQSVVYNSKVGKKAQIGPFTHLRMNTVIGDNDRIGNFVEIKNSIIGAKTNVSHLTYVGDTDCGSGVNFGCGTVTVNYDGKNKFRTKIGNNVFIGCNSNLIAPISIEDGAFIAAGSTITDSLEKDDFAIARARQYTKRGYGKKFGYKKV